MSTDLIETAATALGPILSDVVFLGGASIHLWISDRAAPATRATNDVDVISAVMDTAGYYRLGERLQDAIATSVELSLSDGKKIRAATPPSIVATKLAAWHGRGNNDILGSLDLHDILVLIDGREELIAEIDEEPTLSRYISEELAELRSNSYFTYLTESALHGYGMLIAQRVEEVHRRIEAIIASGTN
jgi:predicted nucleotidyltransferase